MKTHVSNEDGLVVYEPENGEEFLLFCLSKLITEVQDLRVYIEIGAAALNEAATNPESSWGIRLVGNTEWCSALESLIDFAKMVSQVHMDFSSVDDEK